MPHENALVSTYCTLDLGAAPFPSMVVVWGS